MSNIPVTVTADETSARPQEGHPVTVISSLSAYGGGYVNVVDITSTDYTMGELNNLLTQINARGDHVVFDVSALNAGMYLVTIYIKDGYYRIADLVTGWTATGFYASSDTVYDIIKSGGSGTGKHYTVQWDMVNAQGTRLNDASSITTDTTHFAHKGSVDADHDNPFDDIYPWSGRKLCNIDLPTYMSLTSGDDITDCVTAWEGDANFSYTDQYGVWVYTPAFFGRSYVLGNYRYFDVTDENLPNNIAYKPSICGRWHGVDVTLTIDGASKHVNLPLPGMPMADVTLANQHTYAKNMGASLVDIYTLDASMLLYIVEYANANIQSKIGDGVSALYAQGLHPSAASTGNQITLSGLSAANLALFIPNAIIDLGTSDGGNQTARTYITAVSTSNGVTTVTLADSVTVTTDTYVSVHGLINVADEDIGSASGYIGTSGKANVYYRGEVLFANKWQYILGAYRQTGTGAIWIAGEDDTNNYDALNTSEHTDTGLVLPASSGYVKTFGQCDGLSFPPFATETGGSSSAPIGDYVYVPALTAGNTVLLFGGGASNGAYCGFYGHWIYAAAHSYWSCGSRPRLLNP